MVLLRFRTIAASPEFGTVQPGQVVSVPEDQAQALVEGGYAEPVQPTAADAHIRETASLVGDEAAILSQALPKRRGKIT